MYTHVHKHIHKLIHNPANSATQNHTHTETLIDILRAGGLGIPLVECAGVWHGVGAAGCVGVSVRDSITNLDPYPTTG